MICVATVLNDAFVQYFLVLLFSIKKHNPGFDENVVVIHSKTLSPLSLENQARIRRMHDRVRFLCVDEAPYTRFFPVTPPRLHAALLKLEVFRLPGYDRVIFLDSDMLCLGDLTGLLTLDVSFAASLAGKDRTKKERLAGHTRRRMGFNTGVMVIGKEYLNERTWHELTHAPLKPCPTADQDILMRFFRWKKVFCLDHRYNYHAQFFWRGDGSDGEVRLLHYAGPKPLEAPEEPRMRIWFDYQSAMMAA